MVTIKIEKIDDEFQVQWLEDGIKNEAKTYYTDDKEDAEQTKRAMENEACKGAAKKNRTVRDKINAEAALERASQMPKAELFFRELQATDVDDYKILSDRIAALVEELGELGRKAAEITVSELHLMLRKIDEDVSKEKEENDSEIMGFGGFKKLGNKKVKPVAVMCLDHDIMTTPQQVFKLKSYWEQRKALAEMIANSGAHYSNVCEIWKAFGPIMLATEDEKIENDIISGEAEIV